MDRKSSKFGKKKSIFNKFNAPKSDNLSEKWKLWGKSPQKIFKKTVDKICDLW
jgi:hypothetical protein